MKKLFIIFTEIFKPQLKRVTYPISELSLDIAISCNNIRGLKSTIKHYSGMATLKGIDKSVKSTYLKLAAKAEAKLPNAERELNGQLRTLNTY